MSETKPSFLFRFFVLSWIATFRTLFDADFAAGVARLRAGQPALPPPQEDASKDERTASERAPVPKMAAPVLKAAGPDAALQLLGLLQREGRFVDFLQEDLASASDADIGAAARVVHEGCKKAVDEHFTIAAVHDSDEGARVEVEEGFDPHAIRLTGNVVGEPPYKGTLTHRGWRCADVQLPKMSEKHDPAVLAPAEVELA